MPEFNDLKSYMSGYLNIPYTTGIITAGTPVKIDLTNIVLVTANNFVISGGGIKYIGANTIELSGCGGLSLTASLNNTIMTIYRGKNGTVNINSGIKRKIGTGGDLGAAPITFGGQLLQNDIIEIYADSSLGGTVTFDHINISLQNVTL
jgi:hypothetical protein